MTRHNHSDVTRFFRSRPTSKRPLGLGLLAALAVCALTWRAAPPSTPDGASTAPPMSLRSVEGDAFDPRRLRGRPVLLSFIERAGHSRSRSQTVLLRSMAEQYGPHGLTVLVVDASALAEQHDVDVDLKNLKFDWHLDNVDLLRDEAPARTARRYAVTRLPTTILIGADGRIKHRWDEYAPAFKLGQVLRAHVEPPVPRVGGP